MIVSCRYRSTGHQLKDAEGYVHANPQIVIFPSNSVCIAVNTFCNNTVKVLRLSLPLTQYLMLTSRPNGLDKSGLAFSASDTKLSHILC